MGMSVDPDLALRVPGVGKLVAYLASGIGGAASTLFAPVAARLQGRADVTAARYRGEVLRLEAQAQADARELLVPAETAVVRGELDIGEVVRQKVEYQQAKRVRNIQGVVWLAAEELGDESVPDEEVDHDWTSRFFSDVQDVSSEQMQVLWARVLAGQVRNPGSVSIRTLNVLRHLDRSVAEQFGVLRSMCISMPFGSGVDTRVSSLGGLAGQNCLGGYGFNFDSLNGLHEYGLILSSYNARADYRGAIGRSPDVGGFVVRYPFAFEGRWWVLKPVGDDPNWTADPFWVSGIALTRAGVQLFDVVDVVPQDRYREDLVAFFAKDGFAMVEWPDPNPHRFQTRS